MMSSLTDLWLIALKPFLAQSNDGMIVLVQTIANNNFYVGQVMQASTHGYIATTQNTIVLNGTDQIWNLI